jgi:PAS domain S-box-containing protein
MHAIDIRSLALAIGIAEVVQVAALYLQFRLTRGYRGTGWWLLWSACSAGGFFLMLSRDSAPAGLVDATILLTNVLLLAGQVCLYIGVVRFAGGRENLPVIAVGCGAFLLATLFALFIARDENLRVLALYIVSAGFNILAGAGLFKRSGKGYSASSDFVSAVLLLQTAYLLIRCAAAATYSPFESVFLPTMWQVATFFVTSLAGLLLTFGLIIMVGQRANSEMREAHEEFVLIFNTGPDASIISRLDDGSIREVNGQFTALTGYSWDEAAGRSAIDLGLWRDPGDYHRMARELASGELCAWYVAPLAARDGRRIDSVISARAVTIGGVPHAITLIRDNTEILRQDEERQRIGRLDALGRLAGRISGEMEGLLSEALGIVTLAGMEASHGTALRERLRNAEKTMLEAGEKLRRLQAFDRDTSPSHSRVAMGDLAMDTVSFILRGSDIQCRMLMPPDLWPAEIDRGQISQVLNLLVSNAMKAASAGEAIEVSAENILAGPERGLPVAEGRYVRVSVSDQGEGITPEHMEHIFDPFAGSSAEGGLGLAACFNIARRHGGHLGVQSQPGRGTTFILYLPACPDRPGIQGEDGTS